VFPDEFHLATLDIFLATCTTLKEKVNIRTILQSMMNRLANYSDGNADKIPAELDAFTKFNNCITKILEERSNLELSEILRLQTALMTFALKCYPGRLDYVNYCLGMCASVLSATKTPELDENSIIEIEELLSIPLSSLALQVLELKQYAELLTYLPYENRRQVATILVRSTLFSNGKLDTLDKLDKLLSSITPLIKDEEKDGEPPASDAGAGGASDEAEFVDEQTLVARVIHMIKSDDTDIQFKLFSMARKHFGQGGVKRIKHTLPCLVFSGLRLAESVKAREVSVTKFASRAEKAAKKKKKQEEEYAAACKAAEDAATEEEPAVMPPPPEPIVIPDPPPAPKTSCRKVFQFLHEIITAMAVSYPELR
jgi:vacuolar protein sorting-associated protein 35